MVTRKLRLIYTVALCVAAFPAAAQDYPKQRVTMYIGFAAGGFADTVGRMLGSRLSERLGQPFIMQNLEGAGGVRAARQLSLAAPDGYTIMATTTSLAINETLVPNRGYNASSFQAIAIPVCAPESITANLNAGINSVSDLIRVAREGHVYLATPGIGSGSHIASQYFFKNLAKVEVRHIPFSGGNPAMLGLMSGDVNVMASTATGSTLRHIINGEVRPIAVASRQRSAVAPNVPTFAEEGFAGFEAASWVGIFAPAGTPAQIVGKLNKEINAIVQEEETKRRIDALGLEVFLRNPKDTATYFSEEIGNWSKMVEAANLVQ